MSGLRPSERDQALARRLRDLFRRRRRSDFVVMPPLAKGGIVRTPQLLVELEGDEEIIPLLPRSPRVADRIHAQRHYVDDHPATPDTFWAGMRHAERIARGEA